MPAGPYLSTFRYKNTNHTFHISVELLLKSQRQGFESCQVIASDKSNLLRKVDFPLKSGFLVIAFFILLKVGYLVIIVLNFVYK